MTARARAIYIPVMIGTAIAYIPIRAMYRLVSISRFTVVAVDDTMRVSNVL